ncbi:hypothetical protein BRC64_12825 [Halobacteriales archaeon QH_10_67_22]|nr:MAG: hypothetical protein BRC64_12825 [Halobacteriales archaeon QH_10_67_22]
MPATDALYVFSPGEDEGEWVRPQPVEDVVVEEVTSSTDLTADDLDELATYVDLDELETHLADDPAGEALTPTARCASIRPDPSPFCRLSRRVGGLKPSRFDRTV